MQKTSKRGRNDLVHSEGLRLKAYRDSAGVWTIGVGHAATSGRPPIPKAGLTITKAEADEILQRDLEFYEARVRKYLGNNLPQHVFDGAVSFDFNTGSIHKASWVKAYKIGNMPDAERRFMFWKKPPEIIGRRERERDLVFYGKYFTKEVKNDMVKTKTPVVVEEAPRVQDHSSGWVDSLVAFIGKLVSLLTNKRR